MEKEVNTYQQFNFQIALEKIETLTQQNNELLDTVERLENQLNVTTEELGRIRHNHLKDVPVQLWGNIVDNYTNPENRVDHNGWTLLNTATDLLWHKKNPTVASYNQNQIIVDGLCRAVA